MCGPDNFNPNEKLGKGSGKQAVQIKFLELSKISTDEYQMEGLIICIQWYLQILDQQSVKKNQDFSKKLKGVMEDMKAKLAEFAVQGTSLTSKVLRDFNTAGGGQKMIID